jgi:MFS family permease
VSEQLSVDAGSFDVPPASTGPQPGPPAPAAPPRVSWRLVVALGLAAIMWIGPYLGSLVVVLPAQIERVAPESATTLVATLQVTGAVVALFANILFGAFSDLTRSRFGRRAPWIVVGALGSAAGLWLLSTASSTTMIVVWWVVYMVFLNAIIAPMVAVISDRVPSARRGFVSSVYGVSMVVGVSLAQIIGSRFLEAPASGLVFFAVVSLLSGLLFVLIAPERSNRDQPREAFSGKMLLHNFALPTKGASDYYYALFGKFLLQAGMYAVTSYQFFILGDYIGLDNTERAALIAGMATIQLVTSLLFGLASGPISDRVGRRKPFVMASAFLIGVGLMFPFFFPSVFGMIAFSVLSGIGNGVYTSVDQALNIEVLPNKETAAKDLGILNMANSGGQSLGPAATAAIVAATGSYQWAFAAAFAMLVVSALLMHPIKKVR